MTTPSEIADFLDGMGDALQHDREVYATLLKARDTLRTLAWTRWVKQTEHSLRSGHMRARHKGNGTRRH